MFKLKEVIIAITSRCNARCKMCSIPLQKTEELDTLSWKRTIMDLSLAKAETIVLSGGEPLLREDVFELLSYAKNNRMNTCITSNGIMINDDIASKLKQVDITVVNISIEGPEEIHDFLRGVGNFKKAVSALENLKKYNIETTIATLVSKHNYKHLTYVVELANKYKATSIKFQPFSRLFLNAKINEADFSIPAGEILEVIRVIREVILLCRQYGIATNPEEYLSKIPFYVTGENVDLGSVCGALLSSCPINSKGEIFPCWVLNNKENLIGSLKENGFLNIWGGKKHLAIIEKIKRKGCPGCLMSCYDGNFGQPGIKDKIIRNISKLKNQGFRGYVAQIFKKWKKRLEFYSTYKGSSKGIIRKFKGVFSKQALPGIEIKIQGIKDALKEIEIAKQMLKDELKR